MNVILKNIQCSTYYCLDDWKKKQKKMYLINGKYECKEQFELSSEESDLINIEYTITVNDANNFTNNTNYENLNNSFNISIEYNEEEYEWDEQIELSSDESDLINIEYTTIIKETNIFTNYYNQENNENFNNSFNSIGIGIDYNEEEYNSMRK